MQKLNLDYSEFKFIYKGNQIDIDERIINIKEGSSRKMDIYLEKKDDICNKLNKDNKEKKEIIIKYKVTEDYKNEKKIKIFGTNFVLNNKKKSKIIYKDKEYDLTEKLVINENINIKDIIEIKLILYEPIIDMSGMFNNSSLFYFSDIDRLMLLI